MPWRIGCAGWSLSSQVATHFPEPGTHLERYAQVFNAVEINSSFYRPHLPKTYARWAAGVPTGFRFSVKVPRAITHERKLRDTESLLKAFVDQASCLEGKLSCFLLQLPPSLAFDSDQILRFLQAFRTLTSVPIVCEPRHASWFSNDVTQLLGSTGTSMVQAHPPPVAGIGPVDVAGMLYIRLHGAPRIYYSAYDDEFLQAVAQRMDEARQSGREVWCIFDNTAGGEAVPNALTLMRMLSQGQSHAAGAGR